MKMSGALLSHPPRQLLLGTAAVFLVVLAATCKAQNSVEGGYAINITIGSNNRTTAVVPDETASISVVATNRIEVVSPMLEHRCVSSTCFIVLEMMLSLDENTTIDILLLDTERDFNQTLVLTIRESLNYTCAEYPVPISYEEDQSSFVFNCQPHLPAGMSVPVVWRKFRLRSDLRSYQANGGDLPSSIISNSSIFTISTDTTQLIIDNSRANSSDVVYFYVPSFLMNGTEAQTAETILYLGPRIMGDPLEFSIEITFNSGAAENLTKIRCETKTFPPSSVSWVLVNEEHPCEEEEEGEEGGRCGINVQQVVNLRNFNLMLLDYGTKENLTLSTNAIIEMLDLQYDNDGNFTCTADNGYQSETRTFILRVKSPLRPLWPAVGIIGVITLVSLIMLCSYSVERIVERKKLQGYRSPASSPDHANQNQGASVSSTGGQTNNRHHSAVKRLSSAKPLIDESTF